MGPIHLKLRGHQSQIQLSFWRQLKATANNKQTREVGAERRARSRRSKLEDAQVRRPLTETFLQRHIPRILLLPPGFGRSVHDKYGL